MKAVDTNVLLRFLTEDDRAQTRAARRFLTQECSAQDPCLVNRIVLCEMVWVLDRVYRYARSEIAAVLDGLVHASELQIEDHDEVLGALEDFGKGLDFADALLGRVNRRLGCEYTATFDRKAARHPGFRRL